MKKWNKPEIEAVDIKETAHGWTGLFRDGGYLGDGELSGHLTWSLPCESKNNTPAATTDTVAPATPVVNEPVFDMVDELS